MAMIYRISVDDVNRISVDDPWHRRVMGDANERLKQARIDAGFTSARSAAKRFGWKPSTYASHENGQTEEIPAEDARKYARAFRTTAAWISHGEGSPVDHNVVKVVGYIGAGAEISPDAEQIPPDGLKEITLPFPMPDDAVAFEVQGASMLPVYRPGTVIVTTTRPRDAVGLVGQEVAVRTSDGKRYLKTLRNGSKRGRFTLESLNAMPIEDARIEWIGEILCIVPARNWSIIGSAARRAG